MTNKKLLIAGIFADLLTVGAVLYSAARRNNNDDNDSFELYLFDSEDPYEYSI